MKQVSVFQAMRLLPRWGIEHIARPMLIAVLFTAAAWMITFPLQRLIAYPFLFLFIGAVMGAAWFGGFLAGMLTTALSAAIADYFFLPPLFSFSIAHELRSYQVAFVVCAAAIAAISAARRRAETVVREARDELEFRVRVRTAELEQTNREILERERQHQLLTEAIPLHIWRANALGEIDYCNRDLLEYAQSSPREMDGAGLFPLYHPADLPLFQNAWANARVTGEGFELRLRIRDAGGTYRWFFMRVIPQHTAVRALACWYGVHVDIEKQYREQQELQAAQGESARWSRTLSMAEMAVSIAHELKQPLTALVMQAQVCKRWLCSRPANLDKAANSADKLVRESVRASAVIDRIRALFSQKESQREPVNLNELIREMAQLIGDQAVRHGVSIQLVLEKALPSISADPIQMHQLLLNLMTNAIEATEGCTRPRKVTIGTSMEDSGRLKVTVRDNGMGMGELVLEKMFDAFFTTKEQGMGIGLSVCRSIVEAHGGRIWAESLADGGAVHFILGVEG